MDRFSVAIRYARSNDGGLMDRYLVEVSAKFILDSDREPEELPADLYSRISEYIPDNDLMDLEVEVFCVPTNGSSN